MPSTLFPVCPQPCFQYALNPVLSVPSTLLARTCLLKPVKLNPHPLIQINTMTTNTSPLQDLFHACVGFAWQLSQSPGVYCKLELKLGDVF